MKIGIIGLGFVGSSIYKSFIDKTQELNISNKYKFICYDKYKNNGIGSLIDCLECDIIFTALPTQYDEKINSYNNDPTISTLEELEKYNYNKLIIIKSTVEPTFTENLSERFKHMHFVNNPEFLTARTAYEDFHNQKHIILGKTKMCSDDYYNKLVNFYKTLYPLANISLCSASESECVKLYCNTFYSVKIQYFNELYALSKKLNLEYNVIVDMMLKNGWINPMHTDVPGPDGKLSYGGLCFPKDTNALLSFMKKNQTIHNVLEATINERNKMRSDNDNYLFNK